MANDDYIEARLAEIRVLANAGRSLEQIEAEVIDYAHVSDDAKGALWLYAWSFVPAARQREEAMRHIQRLRLVDRA